MSTAVALYGFGSGTGGTLTVTAPVGVTVTVSKDGKSKTRTAGSDGTAVFKGLPTGIWTVSIDDGSQTATQSVIITTDYNTTAIDCFAVIDITYPAGSVCTASDGVTTLMAPDTGGVWACTVPNAGEWVVTAEFNVFTASETVSITESGQSESMVLRHYLYHAGDTCSDLTGGWQKSVDTSGTVAFNSSNIKLSYSGTSGRVAAVYTKKAIDFTGVDTLYVDISKVTVENGSFRVGILDAPFSASNSSADFVAACATVIRTGATTEAQTLALDVSAISGLYYVELHAAIATVTVYNVYLD